MEIENLKMKAEMQRLREKNTEFLFKLRKGEGIKSKMQRLKKCIIECKRKMVHLSDVDCKNSRIGSQRNPTL